jgi:hypothetical protein
MSKYFSIPELAKAVGITPPGFRKKYKKAIPYWEGRRRAGRIGGGGNEYHADSLPFELRQALYEAGRIELSAVSILEEDGLLTPEEQAIHFKALQIQLDRSRTALEETEATLSELEIRRDELCRAIESATFLLRLMDSHNLNSSLP